MKRARGNLLAQLQIRPTAQEAPEPVSPSLPHASLTEGPTCQHRPSSSSSRYSRRDRVRTVIASPANFSLNLAIKTCPGCIYKKASTSSPLSPFSLSQFRCQAKGISRRRSTQPADILARFQRRQVIPRPLSCPILLLVLWRIL
jgi:hypothetical protein